MLKIGIFQGRLSPIVDGKIQAFPRQCWEAEFALAKECGFELMEWVLDTGSLLVNPIMSSAGRSKILGLSRQTGIHVSAVCVDNFLDFPVWENCDLGDEWTPRRLLEELIGASPAIGVEHIEIPLIEKSSIESPKHEESAVALLNEIAPLCEMHRVNVLLETSLSPRRVASFLEKLSSKRILLNFDLGNSAYWKFNPREELLLYGGQIGNIHIKDCTPEKYSVPLGTGNVDFPLIFRLLKEKGYRGDFILQTARNADDHIGAAKRFLEFTRFYVDKLRG